MEHIIQPRGAGTAYRFKMRTPKSLQGLTDPKTEKPFKKWLTRSLGMRVLHPNGSIAFL